MQIRSTHNIVGPRIKDIAHVTRYPPKCLILPPFAYLPLNGSEFHLPVSESVLTTCDVMYGYSSR